MSNIYDIRANRQIRKTERFLRKLSKKLDKKLRTLAKHDFYEGYNEELNRPMYVVEELSDLLDKEGY